MSESNANGARKRKETDGKNGEQRAMKRSKGGSGGKWKTPHQQQKMSTPRGSGSIEPGDSGIWITCAKGQEGRATEEVKGMFEECAQRFYNISSEPQEDGKAEEDGDEDIEASIQKEVLSLGQQNSAKTKLFTPVFIDLVCVLFMKTRSPIDPVDFVHRICEEVVSKPKEVRKMRYINRLTPVSLVGKATEKGLAELGKEVLGKHFQLATDAGDGQEEAEKRPDQQGFSYAIRPSIRAHNTLKRDAVIKQVAGLVGPQHKVNLTKPDKVILVEIYQAACGMSVVRGDWEALKRYNLAELYTTHQSASKDGDST